MRKIFCGVILSMFLFVFAQYAQSADTFYEPMPPVPSPADNAWSQDKQDLGKMLYFDPRLSGSNWISCATCHNPGLGWSDGLQRALGHGQKQLGRNSPSIINSGYFELQFWDGRAKSLEEQALGPIQAPGEMHQKLDDLIRELNAIPGYVHLFKKVFPETGVTSVNVAKAIATFERSIVSKNSPYDKYQQGDQSAMSASAVEGMNLFFGKARCAICHNGPAFTDSKFHNIGVKNHGILKNDLGRYNVTKDKADKGAFKTPGLRHVSRTAPYMHDGSEATLKDVIEFYNRGGDVAKGRSAFITPLGLTDAEKKSLVDFLKALEGEPITVTLTELP